MSLAFMLFDVSSDNTLTAPDVWLKAGVDDTVSDYARQITIPIVDGKFHADSVLEYLDDIPVDAVYPYWRFYTDPGEEFYFSATHIGLYQYIELPKKGMWNWGSSHGIETTFSGNSSDADVDLARNIQSTRRNIQMKWSNIDSEDFQLLEDMALSVRNRDDKREHPVFFHEFSGETDRLYWTKIVGSLEREYTGLNLDTTSITLKEVSKQYVL